MSGGSGNSVPMQGIGNAMQQRFGGQNQGQQQQGQPAYGGAMLDVRNQLMDRLRPPQGGSGGHQMFSNNQQQGVQPKPQNLNQALYGQPMQPQEQQWQPQNLGQAWGQMNNPQQFAQQQAMMQQAMRQRQAQTMQNMPQRAVGAVPQTAQQPGVDPRNLGVLGGWNNYVG